MKIGRFQAILDAYGAAPQRWPEAERADALALSRSSIVAARALAQARALDDALGESDIAQVAVEPADLGFLHARIMAAARPAAPGRLGRWIGFDLTPAQLWPAVAGLAFAMLLGFATGVGGLLQSEDNDFDDMTIITAADATLGGAGQ